MWMIQITKHERTSECFMHGAEQDDAMTMFEGLLRLTRERKYMNYMVSPRHFRMVSTEDAGDCFEMSLLCRRVAIVSPPLVILSGDRAMMEVAS